MSEELTFRKAKREDLPRISEFRKTFFKYNPLVRSYEPEYYDWKCYKNPILPGEMWLAEDGDRLVAMRNFTPKRMKILGDVVIGAQMADSFTHPDYQRRGIFATLSKAVRKSALDKGINFIYNVPTKGTSLPAHIKGLEHVLVPAGVRSLVHVISSKQPLKARLRSRLLASAFSPVIDAVSQAIFRIGMKGVTKSGVLIYAEPSFPDDIDTLWEKVLNNYDVILARTKDYLEWRYVTNPDAYSILIARNRDGAILGYMVIKIGFSENTPMGFICDFLTIEDDPNVFKKLLSASLEEFSHGKVSSVFALTVKGSFYDRILVKLGFLPHAEVPLMCYENELGSQIVSHAYKWHFTMGDSDGI